MSEAYRLAQKEVGVQERKFWGRHNPVIVGYFKDAGHAGVKDDETAWCAAFVNAMLKRAGMPYTGSLRARSFLEWGEKIKPEAAREGDIVVFRSNRGGRSGHVGFVNRIEDDSVWTLGGNQADGVNVKPYSLKKALGFRRWEPPANAGPRKAKAQSTTLQASFAAAIGTAGTALTAVGKLEGTAQIIVIAGGVISILALAYIARRRLARWASGDR